MTMILCLLSSAILAPYFGQTKFPSKAVPVQYALCYSSNAILVIHTAADKRFISLGHHIGGGPFQEVPEWRGVAAFSSGSAVWRLSFGKGTKPEKLVELGYPYWRQIWAVRPGGREIVSCLDGREPLLLHKIGIKKPSVLMTRHQIMKETGLKLSPEGSIGDFGCAWDSTGMNLAISLQSDEDVDEKGTSDALTYLFNMKSKRLTKLHAGRPIAWMGPDRILIYDSVVEDSVKRYPQVYIVSESGKVLRSLKVKNSFAVAWDGGNVFIAHNSPPGISLFDSELRNRNVEIVLPKSASYRVIAGLPSFRNALSPKAGK